ncbi:LysM peptidoglycan-binding domain-containing protein [Moraxella bovis]|uniref:LysM peptidoglycan-binding domain-containing protein n=1 Tax=Moraxella bovis TaxID=476 RepID=UPI002227105D|nr:LysM peptidoglycan-binding domain-containing protein [Moraxella bovis]UZA37666.1 LysM peptidoglycan-binding domain-containing protein [Moraxella bovis]WAJ73986.1 LysM peptidoglycan-binding domain-containing protein [Moraxella bovis]
MPTTLLRILFHDLCNEPMPNLYHEIRENGRTISAGNSDGGGYGVWMRRRIGSVLDIAVKDPKTGAMTTLSARIIVQKPNQSNAYIARVQAPCYKQTITLQPRQGTQGDYRRKTHTVKKGETLEGIAKQYSTTLQILHHLNKDKIKDPNKIQVGWVLKVPPKNSGLQDSDASAGTKTQTTKNTQTNPYTKPKITTSNYQIEKGDTLGSIAQRSGKSISDLQRLNGITDPNKIQAGKYIKTGLPNTPKPAQPATKPSSQPVPTQAPSTSGQSGGILDKVQEVFGDGMDWLDQKTQPIQDKFEQTIDYGSKIFNEGVDVVSQTAGKVKDDALDAVSGLFNDKPSQTQTPSQAPKPTEIKPVQTTEQNERSQEGGTPKVVVERAKPPIIFPLIEQPLNDPGKPYANFDWRRKLGEEGATQAVFNWNRKVGRKHAGRDLYTRIQNADNNAKSGSVVVSIAPGKILAVQNFYHGTHQVTISHVTEDGRKFIIRYGELDPKSVEHLKGRIGKSINQGELLGVTGVLKANANGSGPPMSFKAVKGKNISMLHFEYFTGKGHSLDRADNLTIKKANIYERRADLADPLEILLEGYRATFIKPLPVTNNQNATLEQLVKQLGDIIASGEGSYEAWNAGAPNGQRVKYGKMQDSPGTITGKTINELLYLSEAYKWTDSRRRFATGKYQTIPSTLKAAKNQIGLTGDELYNAEMQERVFREYLVYKQPLLKDFIKYGKGSIDDAMQGAAQEWASIGMPKGRKCQDGVASDGARSFYHSRTNRASPKSTKSVRAVLERIQQYHQTKKEVEK